MAELNNSEMFLQWDERFEKMIHNQLDEENKGISNTSMNTPCMSGVIYYPFEYNKFINCSYCKSQHNTLYLNKHSHNQCSQCGAPLNLK